MRLSILLAVAVLASATQATPPVTVDEVPRPFGGAIGQVRLTGSGMVVGCMERGDEDWLPFAWDPARGLRLIETGQVGPEYSCWIAGVSDEGVVVGYVPSSAWPPERLFVWSDAQGVSTLEYSSVRYMNRTGQLLLVDELGRFGVWTAAEGFIEIGLGDRRLGETVQNAAGYVWGEWFSDETNGWFLWSRRRGLATFLEYARDDPSQVVPWIERVSEDGWAMGHLYDPADETNDLGFVRSPAGEIHTFSLGPYIVVLEAIGRDGLAVGTGYSSTLGELAFVYQPTFGVEVLRSGRSPSFYAAAYDVNAENVVVGSAGEGAYLQGFVWERDKGLEPIGRGGPSPANPPVINDAGWVLSAGFDDRNRYHPFIWSRDTGILGYLSCGSGNGWSTQVHGLSANGVAIGSGREGWWTPPRPFVFLPRRGVFDLTEWLPPLVPDSIYPWGLNDAGQFLVWGDDAADGRRRYLLLTPVPSTASSTSVLPTRPLR